MNPGFDVLEDALWGGEVDDGVEGGEIFRSECNGLDVVFRADDPGVMFALSGDIGY
jgi:hypothetical protein